MPYTPRPDGHNYKSLPIGSERIRVTGSQNKPIWFVKISDELCGGENKRKAPYQWEKKHLWLWKQAYGEIPKGHKIVFLNGNTLDCRLENLFMATDAANMMMTKYGWYSSNPNFTKTAILCCELEILLKKENHHAERICCPDQRGVQGTPVRFHPQGNCGGIQGHVRGRNQGSS